MKKLAFKQIIIILIVLIGINYISTFYFKRFDLTHDKRYTLSPTTLNIIKTVKQPLYIDVFLEGNFPADFRRLQDETRQLLEEFSAYNSNIIFQFVNPVENEEELVPIMKQFTERGLQPLNISVTDKGKQTQEVVFPWAVASYGNKGAKVALLKNLLGASTEEKVISSVQHLEFAFTDALRKITTEKQKKIAILKGNGELEDYYIADFLRTVRENYFIGPFTLDSIAKQQPTQTLAALKKYDLALIAKPTEAFSEEEKEVLDQFIMNGGKTLWLVDNAPLNFTDLNNEQGMAVAAYNELNLTDMFFAYGFRLPHQLIKDEYGTPIKLASGQLGSETQYQQYMWRFSPYIYSEGNNNPIVKNTDGIKFEFASPIELLKNDVKKTVLLSSSQYSKSIGLPTPISLDLVTEETKPEDYSNEDNSSKGNLPVAILLEGKFNSMYKNRVLPFKDEKYKDTSIPTQMIVISDGDIIKNQLEKGVPLELGFDKWTNTLYGNKEFLINCVNYLLDDNGLINIRSKDVSLPLLDREKVYQNYTWAQILTIGLPLTLLVLFGFLFSYIRKYIYTK
ncbi:gliding motility-associated ABC transporter substrate-binding protein GldG [Flavobacterium sp.]|uniref:gliding motility-associated ABC transporter substrate-binding protein GldG n=1 Tax=Flavobacterium sp. TaxID=239 RepID=UPI0035289452